MFDIFCGIQLLDHFEKKLRNIIVLLILKSLSQDLKKHELLKEEFNPFPRKTGIANGSLVTLAWKRQNIWRVPGSSLVCLGGAGCWFWAFWVGIVIDCMGMYGLP